MNKMVLTNEDNMKNEITINGKKLLIEIPSFRVSFQLETESEGGESDHDVKNTANQEQKIDVNYREGTYKIPGAPDLRTFKPEQEIIAEEIIAGRMKKRQIDIRQFKNILKRFKRKKPDVEFKSDDNKTTVLQSPALAFVTLLSLSEGIHNIEIYDDLFTLGRPFIDDFCNKDIISRCHGVIFSQDYSNVYFGDCSRNDNFLNAQKLEHFRYYRLKNQDILTLGDIRFRVKIGFGEKVNEMEY